VRAGAEADELGLAPEAGVVVELALELQAASAAPSDVAHRRLAMDRLVSFIFILKIGRF
jgi:hypothetical protein